MTGPTPAFAYLRVSGRGQIDGDGFPRQEAAVHKYASTNNFLVIQIFREEGISGTNELDRRPALIEMLKALSGSSVRHIIIERLDRLARDTFIQEMILRDLRQRGYKLISAEQGGELNEESPDATLIRKLLAVIAEYDKSMICQKLRLSRDRKSEQNGGRIEGRKAFGHWSKWDYPLETQCPDEQGTVKQILDITRASVKFHGELRYSSITRQVNEAGLVTRTGKPWREAGVREVILWQREQAMAKHFGRRTREGATHEPLPWLIAIKPENCRKRKPRLEVTQGGVPTGS